MRFFLLLILVLRLGPLSGQADENGIRACFDGYKKAILKDKGEKAVTFLDSRTIAYYDNILQLVRKADSVTVDALPLVDKINVLTIRHQVAHDQIMAFDATSLLVYALDQGMVGKSSVERNEIGEIQVDGDTATGQLIADGLPTPLSFGFRKEAGTWKLDLTTIFEISGEALVMLVEESGQSENDFIFSMLEFVSDRKPDASLWQPVMPDR